MERRCFRKCSMKRILLVHCFSSYLFIYHYILKPALRSMISESIIDFNVHSDITQL